MNVHKRRIAAQTQKLSTKWNTKQCKGTHTLLIHMITGTNFKTTVLSEGCQTVKGYIMLVSRRGTRKLLRGMLVMLSMLIWEMVSYMYR